MTRSGDTAVRATEDTEHTGYVSKYVATDRDRSAVLPVVVANRCDRSRRSQEGCREMTLDEPPSSPPAVISPYAGGGGGSVFARRVAAVYLGQTLLGEGRIETRELPIVGAAFRTNPRHEVDDLLLVAGTPGEQIRVKVAVWRSPHFVSSDDKTRSLVATFVREVEAHLGQDRHHVAVAVAGNKPEYEQAQQLARLARDNAAEATFYAQLQTDGRWDGKVRARYDHLRTLVGAGRPTPPSQDQARTLTWQLLQRLWMVPLRGETADESDWALLANALTWLAREGHTGIELRDRLLRAVRPRWC